MSVYTTEARKYNANAPINKTQTQNNIKNKNNTNEVKS